MPCPSTKTSQASPSPARLASGRPAWSTFAVLLGFCCLLAPHPAPAGTQAPLPARALPDSGAAIPEFKVPAWQDSAGRPTFQPGDWDSVLAAYDRSFERPGTTHLSPEFDLHYTKVEGIHLEAGASFRAHRYRLDNLSLSAGYDLGRSRPTGSGLLRLELWEHGHLFLETSLSDQVRPFGNHNPYGNTILALVGGYDARQYLRSRQGSVLLLWKLTEEQQAGFGWTRVEEKPLRTVSEFHLFGPDYWMERNEPADRVLQNGLRLRLLRQPTYTGETGRYGLMSLFEATAFGGKLLRGFHEFSREQWDVWYSHKLKDRAAWHVRTSATLAAGRAPRQAWPDLGGAAGLKAFPPRGLQFAEESKTPQDVPQDAVGALVGTSRLFARVEYQREDEIFRRIPVAFIRQAKLKFVPFLEAGAIWGNPQEDPVRALRDLRLPHDYETHWDTGFGMRRDINYSGFLTHLQVDFAWPMGADTGPIRITLQMSSNWLD